MKAAAIALLLLAVVAVSGAAPADAAYPGRNGAIVFLRGGDLYTLRVSDGKLLRRLTRSEGLNSSPAWSPDGGKIAFASDRNGRENDIYVMRADGNGQTDIASVDGVDSHSPSWSPDGRRIVFVRDLNDAAGEDLYTMDADGSNVRRIVTARGFDNSPAWSPDGKLIAYTHGTQLRLVRPDGTGQRRLVSGAGAPTWSPNGRRLAYAGTDGHIWTIGRSGGRPKRLTRGPASDFAPAWSPDGRFIAFESDGATTTKRASTDELYVMRADGSHLRRLTHNRVDDLTPDWQPRP